jgi:hypothetical protein
MVYFKGWFILINRLLMKNWCTNPQYSEYNGVRLYKYSNELLHNSGIEQLHSHYELDRKKI